MIKWVSKEKKIVKTFIGILNFTQVYDYLAAGFFFILCIKIRECFTIDHFDLELNTICKHLNICIVHVELIKTSKFILDNFSICILRHKGKYADLLVHKNIMQGKLIGVEYILRTYWNQFSLGGICKQEKMPQCSFNIRVGKKHWIWIILIIHIIVSYDQNISQIIFVKDGSHVRLRHPSCVYITA